MSLNAETKAAIVAVNICTSQSLIQPVRGARIIGYVQRLSNRFCKARLSKKNAKRASL